MFFDLEKIENHLLPPNKIQFFSDVKNENCIPAEIQQHLDRLAQRWAEYRHSDFGGSYEEFFKNRNRCNFENLYINRRNALADFVFAEIFNREGKYLKKIEELLTLICGEDTWTVPAHSRSPEEKVDRKRILELYAAETASVVALTWYFLKNQLSEKWRKEIPKIIEERMFLPFTCTDAYGWMGTKGENVNNWNPWIHSNVIFCAAMVCEDEEEYRRLVLRACAFTENYVRCIADKEYCCDEGIRYWHLSGACLFDITELLFDLTDGKVDLTASEPIKKALDYNTGMYDEYGLAANFADATIDFYPDCPLLIRAGARIRDSLLSEMGRALYRTERLRSVHDNFYRQLKDIYTASNIQPAAAVRYPLFKHLPGIDVYSIHKNGFFAVLKGGNNGEQHNHNDVGSFVIYYKGTPLFIDPGVDLYSGYTFSQFRDELWYMNSDYHNLPMIGGKRQKRGREYAATAMESTELRAQIELSAAYAENGYWQRRIDFTGEQLVLEDSFDFPPNEVCLYYMLKELPEIKGNTLLFSCGVQAVIEGIQGFFYEKIDLTGKNPPDGIQGDAVNRKDFQYSVLIPRLFVSQWGQEHLFRLKAIPAGNCVKMHVSLHK